MRGQSERVAGEVPRLGEGLGHVCCSLQTVFLVMSLPCGSQPAFCMCSVKPFVFSASL